MLTQPHLHHTDHVIYAQAPNPPSRWLSLFVLTHDLHVQLWLVTGPDSKPSIKVKEEVVRLSLTYQLKHYGTPETGCEESGKHFIIYAFVSVCVYTLTCFFCVCATAYAQ